MSFSYYANGPLEIIALSLYFVVCQVSKGVSKKDVAMTVGQNNDKKRFQQNWKYFTHFTLWIVPCVQNLNLFAGFKMLIKKINRSVWWQLVV